MTALNERIRYGIASAATHALAAIIATRHDMLIHDLSDELSDEHEDADEGTQRRTERAAFCIPMSGRGGWRSSWRRFIPDAWMRERARGEPHCFCFNLLGCYSEVYFWPRGATGAPVVA